MWRWLILVVLLVACTPRGTITLDPSAAAVGQVRSVFIGTTRQFDPASGSYGGARSETTAYARYDVAIPPQHKIGTITWPKRGRPPDPQADFLTVAADIHPDAAAFHRDLAADLRQQPRGRREAIIFVHGFNTTFSEGVYRVAQLAHDLKAPGSVVHYSWPSVARPLGYVHDRDSATFARDGLDELVHQVAAAGADNILLVAHSMGSALTMETLRQIAMKGDRRTLARVQGVVLISPDMDVDVFRKQALVMGRDLPQPFLIFGSDRDRALGLSARITGERERLGNLADITRLADLKVTYLNTTAYSTGGGHFDFGDSPSLLGLLSQIGDVDRAFDADQTGRTGLLPGVVLTAQQATQIILLPVTLIGDELAK